MISLAFERFNLRRNPFGEASPEEMARLGVVDVEPYVERLRRPGFALQYLGEAGRGKSTHLLVLHQYFPHAPYLRFPEKTRIPSIPQAPLLFLDETQRLPARLRRRIFSWEASFAIATHEDHSRELSRAGKECVSIRLEGLSAGKLAEILARRMEWARRGPGPLPGFTSERIERLIADFGDDLAAIQSHLYEEFQAMEEVGRDDARDRI